MTAATLTRPQSPASPLHAGTPWRDAELRSRPALAPGRLRLTRRGRVTAVLLGVLLLLAAISVGRTGSQAATATDTGPALQQTTVQPGETLWSVAQRIAPGNDPRAVIAQIRRINHLDTAVLRVGQQLLLPVAG